MRKFVKVGFSLALLAVLLLIGVVAGVRLTDSNQTVSPKQVVNAPAIKVSRPVEIPPTRSELLKLINAERAKYGVAPLRESSLLDKSAQWKADDMVRYDYYGHVKPGTTGNDGLNYLNSLQPPCSYIDENLAWMPDHSLATAKSAVDWWMTSRPHRTAILDSKYTLTGFGIVHDAIVEHFCEP